MTLALTGATGFVGRAVIARLPADDEQRARAGIASDVRALARSADDEDRAGLTWVAGSLSDPDALAELMDGAEAVLHIAGLTNTPDPAQFQSVNVDGTANVIKAARKAGVPRMVFVSSLSAREPHLSAYGASKARGEKLVAASGMKWTIIRPPAVYGPRDRDMYELFRSAKLGVVPLPPPGRASLIHVDDLARLLLDMLPAREELVSEMFEPDDGHEDGWSHSEIAHMIGDAVGRKVWAPSLSASTLQWAARADKLLRGKKAKLTADRVGYMCHSDWVARRRYHVPQSLWKPRILAPEGLEQTADWYREHGWL